MQGSDEKPARVLPARENPGNPGLGNTPKVGNTGQYYFLTQIWGKPNDELYLSFIIL